MGLVLERVQCYTLTNILTNSHLHTYSLAHSLNIVYQQTCQNRTQDGETVSLAPDFGMSVNIQYSMSVQVNTCEGVNVSIV